MADAQPRFATPRTSTRETRGGQLAAITRKLGHELMPWQRGVVDVALELLPSGLFAFRTVVVSVPRQNGKTLLALGYKLHRALAWQRQTILYGSTDENASSKKLLRDHWPIIEASPLKATVRQVNRAAGKQAIEFKNGSRIELYGRAESSAHGRTIDLGVADEVWNDTDDRREQALIPAMATRPDAQYLVISTAGTDASLYLQRKRDEGRDAVDSGLTQGIAYFEWSADEDAPIDDPATWRQCMPALGHTISESVVADALRTMSEDEFRRAYLNQWRGSSQRVIPEAAWLQVIGDAEPSGRLYFGVDISPARTSAAIAVADEFGHAELGHYGMGTSWVAPRLIELAQKHRAVVAVDAAGPAGTLLPELEAAKVNVVTLNGREMAAACGALYDAIADETLHVFRSTHIDVLDAAVSAARKRPLGDAWAWARSTATADISPLVALTAAHWAATAHKQPERRPRVVW